MCAFIRGCSGVESFDSHLFSDFGSDRYFIEPPSIIATLTSHHCNTLKEIELTDCYHTSSQDQQAVLSQCKQLRRFWVRDAYTSFSSVGIEFTDICSGEWVCMELTTLGLTLNRYPTDAEAFYELEDEEWDQEEGAKDEGNEESEDDRRMRLISIAAKRVYAQIGRLDKLEELALDIDISRSTRAKESDYAWDLTLSKGWLGEMAGLKNLKTLRLHATLWSEMGQAEVEFMHEQWPLLSVIYFNANTSQLRTQAHWQWFQNKRPKLRYASL